ncbi:hypothetical protein [Nocardia gipuzkoensis]
MQKFPASMKIAAERLAGAFHHLTDKLASRTSGVADNSRKVRDVFNDLDQRIAPTVDFTTDNHLNISTTPVAVPNPGRDGPVMLSGRQALDVLVARYGDRIVFHGSRDAIRKLEPRQMVWGDGTGRRYPDGEPAICAAANYDIPMFMALFKGRALYGYRTEESGAITYRAKGAATEDMSGYTGHVHVMDRQHFQMVDLQVPEGWPEPLNRPRPPELRSVTEIEPFAIVKVTIDDFPHLINDFET